VVSGTWPYIAVMATERRRSGRIEARVTRQEKRLFERAAAIEGRTLTDFIVESARAAASKTIERHETWHLTAEDQRVFVEALLNPPKPTRALRDAMKRHKAAQARWRD
jgi:uncharacterized protein (DUF1778 family)